MVVAMWTRPQARGRGVGAAVLGPVLDWAQVRGLCPDLRVADGSPRTRALLERFGFRADGTTAHLRDGSPLTMSRLVLDRPGRPR